MHVYTRTRWQWPRRWMVNGQRLCYVSMYVHVHVRVYVHVHVYVRVRVHAHVRMCAQGFDI
jgi:hypothetical protein